MLDAIKELGDYVKEKEKLSDVEIFVDKAKLGKSTKKVLCILFQHEDDKITYTRVIPEDYKHQLLQPFILRTKKISAF